MCLLLCIAMCLLVPAALGQQCTRLVDDDPRFGNYTSEEREGLIYTAFETQGLGFPTVMLFEANVVCLSVGDVRDTFTSVSIVANYSCNFGNFPECAEPWSVSQFEFTCNPNFDTWGIDSIDGIITTPADGDFSTVVRMDCAVCVSSNAAVNTTSDVNHCVACSEECSVEGFTECLSDFTCCNFYDNDTCVENCTLPARPTAANNCEVFCDALPSIENGFIAAVSDNYSVESVASYACEAGYNLVGALNRTCTASSTTTFWSEEEPTCQRPDDGLSTGAIVGIVIGIVVAMGIVTVVVTVVAVVVVHNSSNRSIVPAP